MPLPRRYRVYIVAAFKGCGFLLSAGTLRKSASAKLRFWRPFPDIVSSSTVYIALISVLFYFIFFRIRLAAADAKGELNFFKGTKWTGKTVRQRIKFNSMLYVVP